MSLLQRDDDLLYSLIVFFFIPSESKVPIKEDRLIFLNVFEKIQTYTVLSQFTKWLFRFPVEFIVNIQ